jgi:hypothetical protein
MVSSPLIVCERTGRWALAWRKSLGSKRVRLIETRSVAECRQTLAKMPTAAVSLEWRAETAEATCEMLANWDRDFPGALPIVTADRSQNEAETLAREAGAAWFVISPRQLPALGPMLLRHLARQPQPSASMRERIWEQLPWGRTG